ncbi:MAG: hypothetical protein ABIG08_02500 [bacterium]
MEKVITSQCVHYWIIEFPNGPTSLGTCQNCGEERQFRNSMEDSNWTSLESAAFFGKDAPRKNRLSEKKFQDRLPEDFLVGFDGSLTGGTKSRPLIYEE